MSVGKPMTEDGAYGRELGLTGRGIARKIRSLGGADHLRTLDPDVCAVLISPFHYGKSRTVVIGGLKARGMFTRQRGIITQLEKQDAERRAVSE